MGTTVDLPREVRRPGHQTRNTRGTTVVPVPRLTPIKRPRPAQQPTSPQLKPQKSPTGNHFSRPGEPDVTYPSDNCRERERTGARCPGMRVSITITRPPHHSTGVAAAGDRAVTLGVHQQAAVRRPCESTVTAPRPTSGCFVVPTPRSLRGVTGSHPLTSPGSGAVVTGVRKLTCSAISNPRRQGGDEPMSLAPEVR